MAGRSVNKVILLGRLADDPDFRTVASGRSLCRLRIVTNESYKDDSGNWVETPSYHTVVLWGRTAEVAEQYLRKGKQVYIEGSLQTRSWEDRDGNKRWSTEVKGRQMILLGSPGDRQASSKVNGQEESNGRSGRSRDRLASRDVRGQDSRDRDSRDGDRGDRGQRDGGPRHTPDGQPERRPTRASGYRDFEDQHQAQGQVGTPDSQEDWDRGPAHADQGQPQSENPATEPASPEYEDDLPF